MLLLINDDDETDVAVNSSAGGNLYMLYKTMWGDGAACGLTDWEWDVIVIVR